MSMGQESYSVREAAKTYFPDGYTMSMAMRRARRAYFWGNVRGMIATFAFGGAIFYYSIKAVSQDDFEDLTDLIPSAEIRAKIPSLEDQTAAKKASRLAASSTTDSILPSTFSSSSSSSTSSASPSSSSSPILASTATTDWTSFGVASKLMYYWPRGEGLVKGAPALDNLGKMGDRRGTGWADAGRV
ncbi:hypothetical protein [Phaffia rhodozyma]|uniref:Cytochrome c oxidase assembly factor 3 n=1 Tax=Phaffia rhodozyma TaxID=264483 RepID=A0A0F7SNC2_PHARH|nr:hypothetical protein [Phaffia rhodozyma]